MVVGFGGFPVFWGVVLYLWLNSISIFYVISILILFLKKRFSETDTGYIVAMLIMPNIPVWWYSGSQSYFYWALASYSSFCIAVIMVIRENSFVGFPLHFFGMISNGLVVVVNGLKMPVLIDTGELAKNARYVPMNAFTSLNLLGDWIPFPGVVGFFSPGDLLLALGASVAFIEALRIKRGV